MLEPGWLRDKVGSRVVTTICMCYEGRPGSSLVPRIHVIALNFTGRSRGEGKATLFVDGSAVRFFFFLRNILNLRM